MCEIHQLPGTFSLKYPGAQEICDGNDMSEWKQTVWTGAEQELFECEGRGLREGKKNPKVKLLNLALKLKHHTLEQRQG